MTDPTPTTTPPQGLTEEALREQWNAQADEFNTWDSLDSAEQFAWAQKCAIAAHEAARPQLTPEEVEARFRAWWGECYPNVPAGRHTVRSHVAFALHLLGGEVAA
jgi:hypothetical protein